MATPEPTSAQPKISQKLILRTAFLLFVLAALLGIYQYLKGSGGDFDPGDRNSAGMIAAIQQQDEGQQAVVIDPSGRVTANGGWQSGRTDRDLAWRPDGRFLFMVSDRDGKAFHLFRWNPGKSDPDVMTAGTRGRSFPTFSADIAPADAEMLMISGGTVQSFDQTKKTTPQVLPPSSANITQGSAEDVGVGGGPEAEFQALYGDLGTAFRYARWCKTDHAIAAVMQRENGEVLIVQSMEFKDNRLPKPSIVAVGDHIDFDVTKDGQVVYTVQGYHFLDPDHAPAQFHKNGKIVPPFAHGVGLYDPDSGKGTLIGAGQDNKTSFGYPAVSPDGSTLLVVAGSYDPSTESLSPKELLTMPLKEGGIQVSSPLVTGDVKEPSWSPDGQLIAYTKLNGSKHDICTITKDGANNQDLTQGKGDFSSPKFSPQTKS